MTKMAKDQAAPDAKIDLATYAAERGVKYFMISFTDLFGGQRAKLVPAAADAIIGTTLDEAALDALAKAASAACSPIDDKRGTVAFRTEVAGVLTKRAALIAKARAKGDTA